jgi:acetoin utilization protein AcuB
LKAGGEAELGCREWCSGEVEMLLVRDSMAKEVVTVRPETTAEEALALCRGNGIRHLPVLEGGWLVGIISDRDLRLATPALGDPDRALALGRIRVADEMAKEVVTARPEDPIEEAAMEMYERKIGCLPVVGHDGLVGIVTSSDVMRAFVRLVGAHEPGSRVEVALSRRPGAFAGVAGILQNAGANIVSVLASSEGEDESGARVAVFRIDTIDPRRIVESLQAAGYAVRWPPGASGAGRS